ncbi:MAG: hypothetical protein R6U50_08510 [Desulfobacterales bacterium]
MNSVRSVSRRMHYSFRLLALDIELDLDAGADRSVFDAVANGHIIESAELACMHERPSA